MSRYSDEELRAQAIALLRYKEERNIAYKQFIHTVAMITGQSMQYVENKVVEYSRLEIK